MFPPLISPVTLRETLISYLRPEDHQPCCMSGERKGRTALRPGSCRDDAQRGRGLRGEGRGLLGPWPGPRRAGAGSELAPRCLLSALRPPCSDFGMCSCTQPPARLQLNGETPPQWRHCLPPS